MKNEYSAIELVDDLLKRALKSRASDIHLELTKEALRIRFRIDGILHDHTPVEQEHALHVLARVKVLSHLDVAERRIPQDGKFVLQHDGLEIDCRVSTFPALYGEKIVIRILDTKHQELGLEHLGMGVQEIETFKQLLDRQHGIILVAGPTGSGKTTTLYAALSYLNQPEKNIVTLEDPIEYNISGINQGQVHPIAGFTFAKGMRAILRQDPDIIMIGEVRDQETARIAIEAALTGHLVLSTVHTNSALGVVMRLLDMGIEPFLLSGALTGVVAQRLARRLCSCARKQPLNYQDQEILDGLNISLVAVGKPVGCQKCDNVGYKGRVGLFEFLPITDPFKEQMVKEYSSKTLADLATQQGIKTLQQDGIEKLKEGTISLQELLRALA